MVELLYLQATTLWQPYSRTVRSLHEPGWTR